MSEGDREKWNAMWRERAGDLAPPARFLVDHQHLVPREGRALDIAGGGGRHAIWLARRGLDVTVVDVSDLGLERAEHRAAEAHVTLRLRRLDLDVDELPPGPFDAILCVDFLDRAHRDRYVEPLVAGGVLAIAQPTISNLERHSRPSARFLVEAGELEAWARGVGLEVLVALEGWNEDGRHQAAVIARKK